MNLSFFIARRYLFARKSHQTINVISLISAIGVAVTTMALICVLSVFNGFQDLVASCFTTFDPELKVMPAIGKTFSADDETIHAICNDNDVAVSSCILEDKALARYGEKQAMVTLMGVDDNYAQCTDIDSTLYGDGRFILHADVLNYGVPGLRLAMQFNMSTAFPDPIQIYTPRAGAQVNMADPTESFNHDELNSAGVVFSVGQKRYDQDYLLTSLEFAQDMFDKPGQVSAIALKLKPGSNTDRVKRRLQKLAGTTYLVADRYEQQDDVFRIMKTEKYMAYLFLTFILLTACFNIVGSLSMLIIDKRTDVKTLRDLGAPDSMVSNIFLAEGRMISLFGAIAGLALGLLLCYLQQTYGILQLGDKSGAFIVEAYPVSVRWSDVVLVLATVLVVALLTSWYPVKYLSRKLSE